MVRLAIAIAHSCEGIRSHLLAQIHKVRLDSFYIGVNDVTTRDYCEFLNAVLAQKQMTARGGLS